MPPLKLSKRELTRNTVIQAAIDCIDEEGFNAAHTNKIADKAKVSWGVLQYHFGDKDGLLQAVLDDIFNHFSDTLANADLSEPLLKSRLRRLIDVIWCLVSGPEYRVSVAILRNAGRSAESSINGQKQLQAWAEKTAELWQTLFTDLTDEPGKSEIAKRIMFSTLRGFADELNPEKKPSSAHEAELDALSEALAFLLEQ